jgi:hypothetical protein
MGYISPDVMSLPREGYFYAADRGHVGERKGLERWEKTELG